MTRRLWTSLIGVVLIVLITLGYNIATDNTPILGLDLQGGVSVILAPTEPATEEELTVIRDQIRSELERQGIAEPDVRVQGETIVVDLPGVRDQQEALSAVDVSGVVELRPVLNPGSCQPIDTTPTGPVIGSPSDVPTDTTSGTEPQGIRRPVAPPADSVPGDTVPAETIPPGAVNEPVPTQFVDPGAVVLPTRDGGAECLGPVQGTGEVFERGSAEPTLDPTQGWGVSVDLRGGEGRDTWNNLASQCFNRAPTCPTQRLAIVLDSVVQSAPSVNEPNFTDSVSITGNFTQSEAEELASVLNRGAFPVEVEAQEARTVSPSAGSDSLQAAIVAGLVGLALVLVFLIVYYQWLALVIVGGITVWAGMVFSMASFVSGWTNYALSLAGVTGIIVAIGVTVDSYVVFFERIKDELRNGRTIKNAAPRSFKMTWRTIWSADVVSLIAAGILFSLSVGSVRGFALYLGLTTICDLLVCYFFTRPAVLLLARSKRMAKRETVLGMKVATA
ncbi:MAG TPA: protein translocase subunit SecD [Ilumatobacteraceae bacterium]|nr:protein translocase subunit SecD [Ilumatobacteraceae bacterium]